MLSPSDYDADNIDVRLTSRAVLNSTDWYLRDDESNYDWAMSLGLSGEYTFASGESTLSIELNGQRGGDESDLFWGFGDGQKYITFAHDFDGGLCTCVNTAGVIFIYPPCNGPLAVGDISTVAAMGNNYDSWPIRNALAGGSNYNWHPLSNQGNQNTFPVTVSLTNSPESNEVKFTFSSATLQLECVYQDSFQSNVDLVAALIPDAHGDDGVRISSITVNS